MRATAMTVQFLFGLSGFLSVMTIYFFCIRNKDAEPKIEQAASETSKV
jgi:hypothetical protein